MESATQFNLFQWSHDKCAPPLRESEAHVSSVVQLAPVEVASTCSFNEPVRLVFSHGAPDCIGYEVVIKQLEKASGDWVDLDTRDFRTSKGNVFFKVFLTAKWKRRARLLVWRRRMP